MAWMKNCGEVRVRVCIQFHDTRFLYHRCQGFVGCGSYRELLCILICHVMVFLVVIEVILV